MRHGGDGPVGEHGGDRLGHAVQLARTTAEQGGDLVVLVVGEVLGVPAVDQSESLERLPPLARIIRIGAANRLAWVALCRAAWARKPLAEKVCISATLAPTAMAGANE